jgi:1-acyl-sn-glycerol-3-phosphate acyltransferase
MRPALQQFIRGIVRGYFRIVHNVHVEGLENFPRDVDRLIIISNHGSLFDGPLLWAFLPIRFKTLINKKIAELPILRSILTDEHVIKVSTLNSYSL